jgi:hypothetical protein
MFAAWALVMKNVTAVANATPEAVSTRASEAVQRMKYRTMR